MKIVITGGPSAGKTTIANAIQKELPDEIVVVHEAASILFQGGFPKGINVPTTRHLQVAIYHVQKELEAIVVHTNPKKLILCDRGSLDGVAYWPGASSSFFKLINSDYSKEFERYDWVLHLDTAGPRHYDRSNPVRHEDYGDAVKVNNKIKKAWSAHPRRIIVSNHDLFFTKISLTLALIKAIKDGASLPEVLDLQKSFYRGRN